MRKPPEVCFGDLRANLQRFALGGKISMSGTVTEDLSRARNVLVAVIISFSLFEAMSGLAWSFASFLVIRALFGIAMGGEWGVGGSLAMESIPGRWRGWVSGLLQAGYPAGFFLATLLFGFGYHALGWRGMFFVGASPALLTFFIVTQIDESPAFKKIIS